MDLVADHDEVVALGEQGQLAQLVPTEHVPGRVVGVAEEQHADRRIGLEPVRQRAVVERPAVGGALCRHVDEPPAHVGERGEERRVRRRVHDHAVPRRRRDVQDRLDSLEDVAELAVRRRIDRPAEALGHALREQRSQRTSFRREPIAIAEVSCIEHVTHAVRDRRRRTEVHVGHPRRQSPRCVPSPLHTRLGGQPVERSGGGILDRRLRQRAAAAGRCRRPARRRRVRS